MPLPEPAPPPPPVAPDFSAIANALTRIEARIVALETKGDKRYDEAMAFKKKLPKFF